MLKLTGINKSYRDGKQSVDVLQGVSLDLHAGDRLGIMGPSGSGKSTLAKIAALVSPADGGRITLDGLRIDGWGLQVPATLRTQVQLIWQSPRTAVDSRMRLGQIIMEPLVANRTMPKGKTEQLALLEQWQLRLGLTPELLRRFPHEVSDGQLQRACLARALIVKPRYLICDEISSMLDVSTQAALLKVIHAEQQARNIGVLLISHDATLLEHWCTKIIHLNFTRAA